jgi:hypothetical protein
MTSAAVGLALAERLGFAEALARFPAERLRFGALDPLVDLLQETPPDALLPLLVARLRAGTPLSDLVAAGALANARAFGGTDYNGYHALMAMMPSYEMAAQMPAPYGPLPVLKVLHRNSSFLQDSGHARQDALEPLADATEGPDLVASLRKFDLPAAEQGLVALEGQSRARAYEELQAVVRDEMNVHRVVLAWRAYDLLRVTGEEHALAMLRQSVRFCIDEDGRRAKQGQQPNAIQALLPELVEEHGLERRERGQRAADEAWIERLGATLFSAEPAAAARAAAAALAEGFDPEDVGRAMSLAATRLLLHDPGRKGPSPGRPLGSVHGASVGVHASDAANAWRQIARVGSAQNAFACLIAGAYHTAGQSAQVGAQPHDQDAEPCKLEDPQALLAEIEARVRAQDQQGACQAARRHCALGRPPEELLALLLGFAVSEDGGAPSALPGRAHARDGQPLRLPGPGLRAGPRAAGELTAFRHAVGDLARPEPGDRALQAGRRPHAAAGEPEAHAGGTPARADGAAALGGGAPARARGTDRGATPRPCRAARLAVRAVVRVPRAVEQPVVGVAEEPVVALARDVERRIRDRAHDRFSSAPTSMPARSPWPELELYTAVCFLRQISVPVATSTRLASAVTSVAESSTR